MKFLLIATLIFSFQIPALAGQSIPFARDPLYVDFPSPGSLVLFFDRVAGEEKTINIVIVRKRGDTSNILHLDELEWNGGPPTVESVFLANADKDAARELFIIVKWRISLTAINTEGYYFEVHAYDWNTSRNSTERMPEVERLLGTGLEGRREGQSVHYKFKDASSVRNYLAEIK